MDLFETYSALRADINEAINESGGISSVVSQESKKLCHQVVMDIQQADKKLVASGVGKKEGVTTMLLFGKEDVNGKKYTYPVKTSVVWEYYNFRDNHYKAMYCEKEDIRTYGNSFIITSPIFVKRGKPYTAQLGMRIFSVSGYIDENTFADTVGHELKHIFQQDLSGKSFSNNKLMAKVNSDISSQDEKEKLIADILYLCNKEERTAFVQGIYDYVDRMKYQYGVDGALKKNVSFQTMLSLKNLITQAESLRNDEEFLSLIDAYRVYGINRNNFYEKVDNWYRDCVKDIGRLIIKCKTDFIKEGLRYNGDYFHFS